MKYLAFEHSQSYNFDILTILAAFKTKNRQFWPFFWLENGKNQILGSKKFA